MITILGSLANLKLGWGLDSFHHLYSYDINTFGPLTILGSSTSFSRNLSTIKLPQIIFNVSDGVCYLCFGNYV
jgi:hypothetical protein